MAKSDFFTRGAANEGIKLPLYLPNGEPTNDYLVILGVDSDAFRAADMKATRSAASIAMIEDQEERDAALFEANLSLLATLICNWSFDESCTHENVVSFLREAPQLIGEIDKAAADRALYFKKK